MNFPSFSRLVLGCITCTQEVITSQARMVVRIGNLANLSPSAYVADLRQGTTDEDRPWDEGQALGQVKLGTPPAPYVNKGGNM
jgi:hypothetical protein